ncbi:aggrecan core protein-like [Saccostrea echinata]|uniref:aggrecan core protein-like n=1 Tax=Saccostrea echinata TaxID=191078 RepID=UPI002A83CE83|nr:aggrecan core protein-like [Saccostrea echinata]
MTIFTLIGCLYLFSLECSPGFCKISGKENLYREVTVMRDKQRSSNIIFTERKSSKIHCGIQCGVSMCQSFSYNSITRTCCGYDVTITDTTSTVLESGWRTYNNITAHSTITEPVTPPLTTNTPTTTTSEAHITEPPTTTITTTTIASTVQQPSCTSCPSDYTCKLGLVFCYKYFGTRKSRVDAESSCASEGAELVIIDNADKDNEILSYINTNSITELFYWVQGSYVGSQWQYNDGTQITYFRWAPSHPYKYDLLAFNKDNGFHGTTNTYDDVYFCEVKL